MDMSHQLMAFLPLNHRPTTTNMSLQLLAPLLLNHTPTATDTQDTQLTHPTLVSTQLAPFTALPLLHWLLNALTPLILTLISVSHLHILFHTHIFTNIHTVATTAETQASSATETPADQPAASSEIDESA